MSNNSENIQKFITGKPHWEVHYQRTEKAEWRYNEETGIYNNKPSDPRLF
jgi:hypothetical protein